MGFLKSFFLEKQTYVKNMGCTNICDVAGGEIAQWKYRTIYFPTFSTGYLLACVTPSLQDPLQNQISRPPHHPARPIPETIAHSSRPPHVRPIQPDPQPLAVRPGRVRVRRRRRRLVVAARRAAAGPPARRRRTERLRGRESSKWTTMCVRMERRY